MKICPYCQSENILQDAWVDPNSNFDVVNVFDDFYCRDCDSSFKYPEIIDDN